VGVSLLTGLRFDLMVAGYALSVFALLWFPLSYLILLRLGVINFLTKLILAVEMAILFVVSFFDVEWTHIFADRFNSGHSWGEFVSVAPFDFFGLMNMNVHLLFLWFFLRMIFRLDLVWPPSFNFFRWVALLLVLGLMIRGSLNEYHLDLRHSRVTNSTFLNTASISSAYALDQALRQRR